MKSVVCQRHTTPPFPPLRPVRYDGPVAPRYVNPCRSGQDLVASLDLAEEPNGTTTSKVGSLGSLLQRQLFGCEVVTGGSVGRRGLDVAGSDDVMGSAGAASDEIGLLQVFVPETRTIIRTG